MSEVLTQDITGSVVLPWIVGFIIGGAAGWCLAIAVDDWILKKLGAK